MNNRLDRNFTHNYDVVYGPVANDRVYACFTLYEGGVMSKENLRAGIYRMQPARYIFMAHSTRTELPKTSQAWASKLVIR